MSAALLLGLATSVAAQEGTVTRDGFSWSERIAPGAWLRIHNQTGPIEVRETTGAVAEVRAELRASNGRLPEVSFRVIEDGGSYTICAMPIRNSTCTAEGLRTRGGSNQRGSVAFTVLLPQGVKIRASSGSGSVTVRNAGEEVFATSGSGSVAVTRAAGAVRAVTGSGGIEVSDVGGAVSARTGSGGVRVSTAGGPVSATTGSGSIDVRMLALLGSDDMEFRTGSGRITLHLPGDFQGEVDARTGSGGITSAFPITVQGSVGRGRLQGTIGAGGRRVRLTTGSGGIDLRRID